MNALQSTTTYYCLGADVFFLGDRFGDGGGAVSFFGDGGAEACFFFGGGGRGSSRLMLKGGSLG
jgi:hypothetical protein